GEDRGLTCKLWMVHYCDGRDREHHPVTCYLQIGCTEDRSAFEVMPLDGDGGPCRRFAFTRESDPNYLSYVYYWHYTFEPPEDARLSPLQRLPARCAVRPSLTVEVFTSARTPRQLGEAAEFVRWVDRELKGRLPPGARRGSETLPLVGHYDTNMPT